VKRHEGAQHRRTRAVDENSKQERRASLLSAAARLFLEKDYKDILMVEIARAAGLAKGTLYLYFSTKEALFLELVNEQLSAWVFQLSDTIKRDKPDSERIAAAFASTLSERPVLIRLLALLHVVLERNVDAGRMHTFKHQLLELMAPSALVVENMLGLPPGGGVRLLLWMHAFIVGLSQMTSPSPVLDKLLREDEALRVFRLDFRAELEAALTALFKGMSQR
jgi:AcrR family transcriptional regulator